MTLAFKYLAPGEHGDIEIVRTGVGVHNIFFQHELGETPGQLVEGFRVPLAAVYEALAYAAEHPSELEAIRQANAKIEERGLKEAREMIRRRREA
jgi:uncharacterized protein (DUF433 family)